MLKNALLRTIERQALRALAHVFSEGMAGRLARYLSRDLIEELRTRATDRFLETLLGALDVVICLSPVYRETHLGGLKAKVVFDTEDGKVGATARFASGGMSVALEPVADYTVRIRFDNPEALRRFFFTPDPDVFELLLANEVAFDGNPNYIFKLGFMIRDLEKRLLGTSTARAVT